MLFGSHITISGNATNKATVRTSHTKNHQIPLKRDREPTSSRQEVKPMLMPTSKILTPQINTSKVMETILLLKQVSPVSPSILVMDYHLTNSSPTSLINFKHKE